MVKTRSLLVLILLSIVTLGIYPFIWFYGVQRDLNLMCKDGQDVNPGLVIVLFLFTFGIYPIIWFYLQGERMKNVGAMRGVPIQDSGSTYLLWLLLGAFLCGIGSLVGIAKFIKNFNTLAAVDNHQVINNAR